MVAHGRAPGRRCRCHCRCTLRVIGKEAGAFHSLDSKPPNCARPRCFLPRLSGMKAKALRNRIPIWAAALSLCLLYKSTLTDALARLSFESNNRTSQTSPFTSLKKIPFLLISPFLLKSLKMRYTIAAATAFALSTSVAALPALSERASSSGCTVSLNNTLERPANPAEIILMSEYPPSKGFSHFSDLPF